MKQLAAVDLDFKALLLWYSENENAFVVADQQRGFTLPIAEFTRPRQLGPAREPDPLFPCRLPLPESLIAEFSAVTWHGFGFLTASEYDVAIGSDGKRCGDLLRTLYYGPDYGLYVRHKHTGLIVSLRSGSLELLRFQNDAFELIATTRTRGRAALCFASHATEPMIAYGDNYGAFHIQRFTADGFGTASKIDSKERKAAGVEFIDGDRLLTGGMGYLSVYGKAGKKWKLLSEASLAVRSFHWHSDSQRIVVNGGRNGLSVLRLQGDSIKVEDSLQTDSAIDQISLNGAGDLLAASLQNCGTVQLYQL
ncbi:MAG: hypothetical protein KDA85_22020 [Planctomycetaceae bacterium]|nr:hypothetical protein [Planctomycetaceae bacterium]